MKRFTVFYLGLGSNLAGALLFFVEGKWEAGLMGIQAGIWVFVALTWCKTYWLVKEREKWNYPKI